MSDTQATLEQKVQALNSELTSIRAVVTSGFEKMNSNFSLIERNFSVIKRELDGINSKIDGLTQTVNSLSGKTEDGFDDVGGKLENLSDEIAKISAVTGYDSLFSNLQEFSPGN